MTNIWKSLLGKEQQGEEGRENTPALIVCVSLGGYTIDRLSQVLVIILLRRIWRLRTDLSTAITVQLMGDMPELNVQHPRRQAGVTTGASHLTLLPPYLVLITMIIFSNICCFSDHVIHTGKNCGGHSRGCTALQVGHAS